MDPPDVPPLRPQLLVVMRPGQEDDRPYSLVAYHLFSQPNG